MQTILFVCVQNAGRSQMAEAFFNAKAKECGLEAHAESAGTRGAGGLYSLAVRAMEEVGIPMTDHIPKQLKPEMVERANLIVAMGNGISAEGCPAKFLVTEDWDIEDPAGQSFGDVRKIRDAIGIKVDALVASLA
jgi:arsenate reductase